jgi:integrase
MPQELTELSVKAIKPPEAGATTIWDSEITGFGVRVFAPTSRRQQGARSFFMNYRIDGRERRFTIGSFPEWSAWAARKRAKELRRRIDCGEDPASEKRERREAPTVADLAERYRTEHLCRKAASSQRHDWQMIQGYILPRLGSRKAADIHSGDIEGLHKAISARGTLVRANRVLAVCSKMFSIALKRAEGEGAPWRDHAQGNPCKGVERNQEEGHERFFSEAELAAISEALNQYPVQSSANCVRLIMLTGCRPGEAMSATWDQFDNEPGFWVKPSSHTKQRRVSKVPLSPAALELIARARKSRDQGSAYVFPGQKRGEPLKQLHTVWRAVADAAGVADARLYDLRHTFASVGAGGGLSLQIIGRLLGHTQQRTTARYAHLGDDPLREAATKIATQIAGAGKSKAEIVQLPKRGGVA